MSTLMSDDESPGTHQGVTYLIINTLEQEYDEWRVKCKILYTLHQGHLKHYDSDRYSGVELVKGGEETLHPHYLLIVNRLNRFGVECRVFLISIVNFKTQAR